MFHTARQYCPVDSIAMAVTLQLFNQAQSCFKSRVKVRKLRFFVSVSGFPDGAKRTPSRSSCVRRCRNSGDTSVHDNPSRIARAKDAWRKDR